MATKIKPCTVGKRHTWEWVKDTTTQSLQSGLSGARMSIARRGIYKCACGERKYGDPRSGL
jgi:hypothetical protein